MVATTSWHIRCSACSKTINRALYNTGELIPCASCGALVMAEVFPAHDEGVELGQNGEAILVDTDASCFYHPEKKAAVSCESCGRFLCLLCDINLNDKHICTSCVESGKKKGKLKHMDRSTMRWDRVCLALAVLPLLIFYLTIFTAPATIYLVIRHWKDEMRVIPYSKAGYVIAFIFALLQVVGWVWGIAAIVGS